MVSRLRLGIGLELAIVDVNYSGPPSSQKVLSVGSCDLSG